MRRIPVLLALVLAAGAAGAQESASASAVAQLAPAAPAAAAPAAPAEPTLQVIDTRVGTGAEAVSGKTVRVHYTGWLYKPLLLNHKGRMFDSSLERGEPIAFPLGAGHVIKGWDQGVAGMKVGGKRTLIIPAQLAYGAHGAGNGVIPPDADLIFDVELVGVN